MASPDHDARALTPLPICCVGVPFHRILHPSVDCRSWILVFYEDSSAERKRFNALAVQCIFPRASELGYHA